MTNVAILGLYYLCAAAGVLMIAGGLWLLYKQKIYIDSASNQVTEIETPIGKFKTNLPALVLFVLGFFPLIVPLWKAPDLMEEKTIKIISNIDAPDAARPIVVYVVTETDQRRSNGPFSISVPAKKSSKNDYKLIYAFADGTMADAPVPLENEKDGKIEVRPMIVENSVRAFKPSTIRAIPSEFKANP
jgi:hypothetical protein